MRIRKNVYGQGLGNPYNAVRGESLPQPQEEPQEDLGPAPEKGLGLAGMIKIPEGKEQYDFYRCRKCLRLITKLEELSAFKTGKVCPCGSASYVPANMRWYDWFLPRVWKFAWERINKRA